MTETAPKKQKLSSEPSARTKPDEKKRKRKDKKSKAVEPEVETTTSGFSIFGGKASTDLDDVFSKSAIYAKPVEVKAPLIPVIATAKMAILETDDSAETEKEGKQKRGKRKSSTNADAVEASPTKSVAVPDTVRPVASSSKSKSSSAKKPVPEVEDDDSATDSEEDLVHESLKLKDGSKGAAAKKKAKQVKYIPEEETSADRDRRTIFVGNLPIETAKSKSVLHSLKAHILTFAPTSKIESVRFRSIPFATPTANITGEETEQEITKREKREKERASSWKETQEALAKGGKEAEEADRAQSFIDAKGKRKVAFIKKDFHTDLESCNAYVVFGHPHPDRAANVAPIMDPYEAATAALKADGSTFMDRTIRVDTLRLPSSATLPSATNALAKRDAWLPKGTDPKKSVFVGGLDYAAKEEDVRVFFEELLKKERGTAPNGSWITGVRIIRDPNTQMGKGFGYVQTMDRESVDELLGMDSAKLKFAKKQLRVQRSKTLPVVSKPTPATAKSDAATPKPPRPTSIPKGNSALGDKLKDLSKEERKVAKATDAERQARRLAKKKMRMSAGSKLDTGAVKLVASKAEKQRTKSAVKAKKGRGRSAAAVSKMKGART